METTYPLAILTPLVIALLVLQIRISQRITRLETILQFLIDKIKVNPNHS